MKTKIINKVPIIGLLFSSLLLSSCNNGPTKIDDEKKEPEDIVDPIPDDPEPFENVDDDVEARLLKYERSYVEEKVEGLNAKIITYYDDNVKSDSKYPVIVYYTHYNQQRPGTESNESIIRDYLKNYIVVYVDFMNQEGIDEYNVAAAALKIKTSIVDTNKYLNGMKSNQYLVYSLPSSYRLKTDIVYFDLTKSSSTGSYDFIVDIWNQNFVKSKVGSKWTEATTIDDIPMKNGDKLMKVDENGNHPYMQYKMDIFYPSKPVKPGPVIMNGATGNNHRNTNTGTSDHADRINFTESLLKGYTMVTYDHEYVPFMLGYEAGWGHIQKDSSFGYSMMRYDGVKAETAAVRCVKYFADELGYSKDNIGVFGHSKASWCSCLSVPHPETQEEDLAYNGYTKGENRGPQPYLEDKNGNALTGDIKCVYFSMGWGSERYELFANKDYRPQMISCGSGDPYGHWDYFYDEVEAYETAGCNYIAAPMTALGHTICPHEKDPKYGYYYDSLFQAFFDYHLGLKGPQFMYSNITNGKLLEDGLMLQFVGNISEESINTLKVVDDNNTEILGTWKKESGGNRYIFSSSLFENETKYHINIGSLKDNDGKEVLTHTELEFVVEKIDDVGIIPVKTPSVTKSYTSIRNAGDFFDAASWQEITGTSGSPAYASIDPNKKDMYCDDGSICISNGTNARIPMFYVAQNNNDKVWKHLGDNGKNFDTNIAQDMFGKDYSFEITVTANDTFQIGALVSNSCGDSSYSKSGFFYEINKNGIVSLNVASSKADYRSIGEYTGTSNFDFSKENTIKFVINRASKSEVRVQMLINNIPLDLEGTPQKTAFSFKDHFVYYSGFVGSNGMGGTMSINPTEVDGKVKISDISVTYC